VLFRSVSSCVLVRNDGVEWWFMVSGLGDGLFW